MTRDPDLLLFDANGSPCARRVKISLIEKGLRFRTHAVDLAGLEQRHPAYLALNPNGLVPTFVHDGFAIWESNTITEYLDDAFPDTPLYPASESARVEAKRWQAAELALAKTFRPLMYQRMLAPLVRFAATLDEVVAHAREVTDDPAFLAWEEKVWHMDVLDEAEQQACEAELIGYLDRIEAQLDGNEYLLGDTFSTADISVFPRMRMYRYVGLPIAAASHPNLRGWLDRLERRRSFRRTRSRADRGMDFLLGSGAIGLIDRAARMGTAGMAPLQRLALWGIRPVVRRVLGYSGRASRRRRGVFPSVAVAQRPERSAWFPADERASETVELSGDTDCVETAVVVAAARYLGVACRVRHIDAALMQHRSSDYLSACPSGELPVLRDGDLVVGGVGPIVEHLCIRANDAHLVGADAELRARVRMWHAFDRGMHKETKPFVYLNLLRPRLRQQLADDHALRAALPRDLSEHDRAWILSVWNGRARIDMDANGARSVMRGKLRQLDERLGEARYVCGNDSPTLADLALVLRIGSFHRIGFDWSPTDLERVARWREDIRAHFALDDVWHSLKGSVAA